MAKTKKAEAKQAEAKQVEEKKEGAGRKAPRRKAAPAAGPGKEGRPRGAKATERKAPAPVDLEALRKPVDEAKTTLALAEAEAHEWEEKARALLAGAREAYRKALTPYRAACRRARVPCAFEGGRGSNVSAKVSFEVEKTPRGVRVAVKGRPETEEVIPLERLRESVNREAYRYTGAHLGPREEVGNKGGSLGNRLRAVLGK